MDGERKSERLGGGGARERVRKTKRERNKYVG